MTHVPQRARVLTTYRLGPAIIDVDADDPDAARWLTEFLTPWFGVDTPGGGEFTVRLTCSPPAVAALEQRQAAAICHPVACFALDSQVVSLPSWAEEDGDIVIADSERKCFYRVRPPGVEVVTRQGVRRTRVGLMRVVREFAAARVLAQGNVLDFHTAAFAVGERAVLLVGPKGGGKTTLLVSVLASGRATLIANDRVFADVSRRPGQAFGVPTLVSLRDGTLQLFPNLRHGFPKCPARLHTGELESGNALTLEADDVPRTFVLSPVQLARRLGVPAVRGGPIAAVVFPEICSAVDTWSLESVPAAEGASRLRKCLYGTRSGARSRTIFEQIVGSRVGHLEEPDSLIDRLAAWVPFFRCRLGPGAYREGADGLLRALPLGLTRGRPVA